MRRMAQQQNAATGLCASVEGGVCQGLGFGAYKWMNIGVYGDLDLILGNSIFYLLNWGFIISLLAG